jgi:hypothetical protein
MAKLDGKVALKVECGPVGNTSIPVETRSRRFKMKPKNMAGMP